ncbi:MAG: cupin domain-containing protein [Myxococcota bacterium]
MDALWVEGGAAAARCIRGFARLRAGATFPDHTHLGVELQLVLEGTLLDSNGVVARPGDIVRSEPGTSHSYFAAPGGPDLLFFVVAAEGIELPGGVLRHRDPIDG